MSSDVSYSRVLIGLLKGVLYRSDDPTLWHVLLERQSSAREHFAIMGLEIVLDDGEGCAYLRQAAQAEGEPALPRLVPRRPLSYPVSLILVLLRKKLVELDTKGGDTRLIVSRDDIVEMVRLFLSPSMNEARFVDRIDTHINKIVELGFLRRLPGQDGQIEVLRILKAYVDAQWLDDFEKRLASYLAHAVSSLAADDREPT
jgi:Domain of unknown function (DUF4194)